MPLVALAKFKRALQIDDATHDARLQEALDDAETAVRSYANRDFGAAEVTESRTFYTEGARGGYIVDIDDATAITAVSVAGTALPTTGWRAYAEWPPGVYTYIELLSPTGLASPEMGFTWNADKYKQATAQVPVAVTATYGWATAPLDVQRAVIFTAASFLSLPSQPAVEDGRTLQAESIAEYARQYMIEQQMRPETDGVPERAARLLDPYVRHSL